MNIKNYKTFVTESPDEISLTPEQLDFLNNYVRGYWNLNDGVVDVIGNFNCFNKGISDFKNIKFGKISGYFNCNYNNLTSLEGCPKEVGRFFYFDYNKGASSETLKLIYDNILSTRSDYKTVLKSLWKEIPIEDKVLLYSSDLDWVERDEASKLSKLKKYSSIKKMI